MFGRRNIVLTGFMGCGKTAAGRVVAERLSRRFVDMDEVLSDRFGMPLSDVFSRLGEPIFRRGEATLCRELAQEEGLVIATGGGALVNPENRLELAKTGILICLQCDPEILWQRVGEDMSRPMLEATDRRQRLEELLNKRNSAYAEIAHRIDTGKLTVEQVASRVIEIAGNAESGQEDILTVHYPGGLYPLFITEAGLSNAGMYALSRNLPKQIAIITDDTVGAVWGDTLWQGLQQQGFLPSLFVFPAGERQKNLATVEILISKMVEAGLARDCAVLALGGGVVGDTAGLVAALYMRGVPFIQAPTSLLAMIDSSVGGKVAVDLPAGKNLVGAFKQPEFVLIDVAALSSLSIEEWRAGAAEAIKAGIIGDADLFTGIERGALTNREIVRRSLQVKINIVEKDPFERGQRMLLNLGHTFAHAYELLSDYRLRHGEAVAIGLVLAAQLAASRGICQAELVERVCACLRRCGLPAAPPEYAADKVIAAMRSDKKRAGGKLRFILPEDIGRVIICDDVEEAELLSLLAVQPRPEG